MRLAANCGQWPMGPGHPPAATKLPTINPLSRPPLLHPPSPPSQSPTPPSLPPTPPATPSQPSPSSSPRRHRPRPTTATAINTAYIACAIAACTASPRKLGHNIHHRSSSRTVCREPQEINSQTRWRPGG
eukprot:scaffold12319_cov112-Isochrysis_galbana.AAC.9